MRHKTLAGAVALAIIGVTVAVAQPAWAASAVHGYVWGYQPAAASYLAVSGYEHNSAGGKIQIVRSGAGDYRVRFAGMAASDGVAHASAYGSGNSNFCTIAGWASSGADELLRIRCFNGAGAPTDSMFVASFTNDKAPSLAYAFGSDAVPAGWYEPAIQYDSTGAAIQITRTGVGHYLVDAATLAGDAPGTYYDGYLRATAYGSAPVRCEVLDPVFYAPTVIPVICIDINGAWVDSRFTVSYSRTVNLLGQSPPYGSAIVLPSPVLPPSILGWTNPGGAPTAVKVGQGSFRVTFPGLAARWGHATAHVFGTPPAYCTVAGWWPSAGDEVVAVQCYDGGNHEPTDVYAFNVTFTH